MEDQLDDRENNKQGECMKEIQLTQGQKAIVDDEDFEGLMKFRWYATFQPRHNGYYAVRWEEGKTIRMHRQIISAHLGQCVDHKNQDSLDNRRENLRFCSNSQNMANQGLYQNNSSGLKGVDWHASRQKWRSYIRFKRKKIYLGSFDVKQDAADAYDAKARELFGEFAWTNADIKKKKEAQSI